MIDPGQGHGPEPAVAARARPKAQSWSAWLVYFFRGVAVLSMVKGLYAWGEVCGFVNIGQGGFETKDLHWQSATVFFAVFDLVAAVGLWLTAPWGAVVWLTSSISLVTLDLFFAAAYDVGLATLVLTLVLMCAYLALAILSAREGAR